MNWSLKIDPPAVYIVLMMNSTLKIGTRAVNKEQKRINPFRLNRNLGNRSMDGAENFPVPYDGVKKVSLFIENTNFLK